MAHAHDLFPTAAGLGLAPTPRHANILFLVGELPAGLAQAAAVAYAQMPRPRAILSLGSEPPPHLPRATITASLSQVEFTAAVGRLRDTFARSAWSESAPEPFHLPAHIGGGPPPAEGVHQAMEEGGHGSEQRAAMEHGGDEATDNREPTATGHAGAEHAAVGYGGLEHHELAAIEHERHETHQPMAMDHGEHGGRTGGFMSMAIMTENLPRSPDVLPMEWLEVPFGPIFLGLPGGLGLNFTLDGDTVASARVDRGVTARDPAASWAGSISNFPARFAAAHPLARASYRILAGCALTAAGNPFPAGDVASRHVTALEYERVLSHLNWLSTFGLLIGDAWLTGQATSLQRRLYAREDAKALGNLRPAIADFVGHVAGLVPLRWRLQGVGQLPDADAAVARGPVARASALSEDARNDDPHYRQLGFAPVMAEGGDSWARLRVRLEEIRQSLHLIGAAAALSDTHTGVAQPAQNGEGTASIETPRGRATLRVTVHDGEIQRVEPDAPSADNVRLVDPVSRQEEVGDALAAVAFLLTILLGPGAQGLIAHVV